MINTRESALQTLMMGVIIVSMIFASYVSVANAQSGLAGLSMTPPNTDLTVLPAETVTRILTVSNEGSESISVTMTANNFTASGEDGGSSYLPAGRGGLADWMTLAPSSFVLAGGTDQEVSVTISVAANASAGGHYATVFAYTENEAEVSGSGASVTTAIGANFLLNVAGNVVESASIVEFSTPRSRLNAGEGVDFTLRVSNNGNTHLIPTGVVELYRNDVKVDEVAVNSDGGAILPNSTRKFTLSSDKTLLPGAYSAVATLSYGSGEVLTSPSISFAVIGDSSSMTLVAGGLGALVVLLALALLAGRKKSTVK